jgi:hypothetical protein
MVDDPITDPPRDTAPALDAAIERLGQQMVNDSPETDGDSGDIIPAGHPPPSPASLDDIGVAHAIDGDGAALCQPHLRLEQVDHHFWNDVPNDQRCLVCAATLDV